LCWVRLAGFVGFGRGSNSGSEKALQEEKPRPSQSVVRKAVAPVAQSSPRKDISEPLPPKPDANFPILTMNSTGKKIESDGTMACTFCGVKVQDWAVHEHTKRHFAYREGDISSSKELYQRQAKSLCADEL